MALQMSMTMPLCQSGGTSPLLGPELRMMLMWLGMCLVCSLAVKGSMLCASVKTYALQGS